MGPINRESSEFFANNYGYLIRFYKSCQVNEEENSC